tara:strand:- start:356 stop:532 length:177 start_codon:yes stop_codon:yes gene_type:complete
VTAPPRKFVRNQNGRKKVLPENRVFSPFWPKLKTKSLFAGQRSSGARKMKKEKFPWRD